MRERNGQSLVEFTLVLPILLLLLIVVADFGRLFAAGIVIESAARTAAEVAADKYLREPLAATPPPPIEPAGYDRVHAEAWRSVCDEAATLPNATPGSGGGQCDGLPTIVCVHDGGDPSCANHYNDASGLAGRCSAFQPAVAATNAQAGGTETSKYVEVRVCYRFTTLLRLDIPFFELTLSPLAGEFFLEKTRTFTVADY